ncbi:MAG: DUF4445 domain-containing protein [Desulfovibrionales bacterium]|nr:MAG: DUF4445 domain-containing protein [Desulfovibrionales bacterium]
MPGLSGMADGHALLTIQDTMGRVRLIQAIPGQTLSQMLFLERVWPTRPFCSGLGKCGLCLVYVANGPDAGAASPKDRAGETPTPDELAALSPEELEQGGRLACRCPAVGGMTVHLPFAFPSSDAVDRAIALSRPAVGSLSLAVDLGTTGLDWLVRDDVGVLAQGRELNPQLAAGSEVMSRLGFALMLETNARMLRDVVVRRLHDLTRSIPTTVDLICVAGNTVMTALLLDWPLQGLAVAPYRRPHPGGFWTSLPFQKGYTWEKAGSRDGSSNCGGRTYIPPQPAPFIGGDVSAGLAAIHFGHAGRPAYPFLLADLGTNGEFILALGPEHYLAASVPMGPALEGIGMSCGSAALPGVWVDVAVTPLGLRARSLPMPERDAPHTLSPSPDRQRISGTGYLALLAGLLRLGVLKRSGGFADGQSPLARNIGANVTDVHGERRLVLGADVFLTGRDVEEVLKVKAAFNLAMSRLLAEAGLTPGVIRAFYLAGALGEHVDLSALEELGFVPPGSRERMRPVGNTSLAGAALLVASSQARDWIEEMAPRIMTLPVGQEPDFFAHYTQRLVFHYV